MVQIIILAMIFLFVGLRLWSVLGRRTGHEQPIVKPIEAEAPRLAPLARAPLAEKPAQPVSAEPAIEAGAAEGVRAIVAADPGFDVARFLAGAQGAYRMTLEAFWKGDIAELDKLADDEVRGAFAAAIAEREAEGHTLDNRLVAIERAAIERARIDGRMAYVTVRFDADVAAVTRDRDGQVIAGSLSDAVPTHDVWTFSRHVRADDPNWILVETDDAE